MTGAWEPPRLAAAVGRAALRRCPRCGRTGIFRRWMTMAQLCPQCGLRFEREEGYWTGAVAINLIATEGLFIVLLVLGIVATWPDVPWTTLLVGLVAVNIVMPIVFQPFSRTLWVAIERSARRWVETEGT